MPVLLKIFLLDILPGIDPDGIARLPFVSVTLRILVPKMYGIFLLFSSFTVSAFIIPRSATNTLYYRNQCLYICCISRPYLTSYWLVIRAYHHSCNHLIQVRTMILFRVPRKELDQNFYPIFSFRWSIRPRVATTRWTILPFILRFSTI